MSLLITGSSGFVGRHLVERLAKDEKSYFCIQRSPRNEEIHIPSTSIQTVIHLAGLAHNLADRHLLKYEDYYDANCDYALRVARAAISNGATRFVYVSSASVYGKSSSKEPLHEDEELKPFDDYGRSKLQAEIELKRLSEELGFELVIIRPSLTFGFDAKGNIQRLLNVVSKFKVIPLSNIKNSRSFLAVENLVDFLILAAVHPDADGCIFNISDSIYSTREIVESFAAGMGRKLLVLALPNFIFKWFFLLIRKRRIYEQVFGCLIIDNSLARTKLQWTPAHDPSSMLKNTGKCFANRAKKVS